MDTYEKKYKNALTIAQSRFKIEKDESVLTCLGMMFPELRESEDERARKAALEGIEYLERKLGWDAIGDTDILDVKEYLEKQKEQKPAEDKYQQELEATDRWQEGYEAGYNAASKPAEWSEEDTLMLTAIIQTLERFGGRGTTGMQIAWLKSLRPSWKPSEEQMRALIDIICFGEISYVGQEEELIALKNQLKKLM